MTVRVRALIAMSAAALFFVACGSSDDGREEQPDTTEQAARKCAVRCAEGYVLTRQCTCEPSSCTVIALCVTGYTWDDARCRCVRDRNAGGGESCGSATCGAGQVCCNASCGICTPPDGYCTQQVCESTPL